MSMDELQGVAKALMEDPPRASEILASLSDADLQSLMKSRQPLIRWPSEREFEQRCRKAVLGKLYSLAGNRLPTQDVSDLVIESIYIVMSKTDGEVIESIGAYSRNVVTKKFFSFLRKRGNRREDATDFSSAPTPATSQPDASRIVEARDTLEQVEALVSSLPKRPQAVFELLYTKIQTEAEVCEQLDISRDNLRVQRHTIRKHVFRGLLAQVSPDELAVITSPMAVRVAQLLWRDGCTVKATAQQLNVGSAEIRRLERLVTTALVSASTGRT